MKNLRFCLATIVFTLLAGLSNTAAAKPVCPSKNFNLFVKSFANDVGTQKAFTHLPLKTTYRDGRVETNPFKTDFVNAGEIQYPIMLSEYRNNLWTLPTQIRRVARYAYVVRVTADNSTTTLRFQKTKSCWQLNSVYNPAL